MSPQVEGSPSDRSARRVVLVSGAPGAGKTRLATALAPILGLPLIAKDHIKEAIWDGLDPPDANLEWSRRIGGAAMEVLWALAGSMSDVMLEANFRPHSDREQARLRSLGGNVVEVYCACPPEEAARRYAERAKEPRHHRAHVLSTLDREFLAAFDRPMGVGSVISVDTTSPVDVSALARSVADELARAQGKTDQLPI
jgi:predicted kinase